MLENKDSEISVRADKVQRFIDKRNEFMKQGRGDGRTDDYFDGVLDMFNEAVRILEE